MPFFLPIILPSDESGTWRPISVFPPFSQTFSPSKLAKLAATGKTLFQVLVPILARGKDTPSNLVSGIVPQI
jgi:hypothetical protein